MDQGRRGDPEFVTSRERVAINDLAEKYGSSVTELRYEIPELMACIRHGNRLAVLGHPVPGKDFQTLWRCKRSRIEPELPGEFLVQPDKARRDDRSRPKAREKSVRQTGVAVI